MKYNPDIHHRRSIRLKEYDYLQAGAYFVTICTKDRECLLGEVVGGEVRMDKYGQAVVKCWEDLPVHYSHIKLDSFIIMPNHIHGIIVINNVGAGLKPALNKSDKVITIRAGFKPAPTKQHGLPEIVRAFKTFSSRHINLIRNNTGVPLWQRNYYEHIIRNEQELNKIREYIINNPSNWETDENYKV